MVILDLTWCRTLIYNISVKSIVLKVRAEVAVNWNNEDSVADKFLEVLVKKSLISILIIYLDCPRTIANTRYNYIYNLLNKSDIS